jgi:hypothetical protein
MMRFVPDTWRDALLRPIAMAAPDAGVYVEIMAPDFRFVFILALALIWAVLALRRDKPRAPTLLLFAFTTLAFVPWLATSGNGRYFISFLLIAGPLCLALIHQLPCTKVFRATLAVLVVATQLFLIRENSPWRWWGLAQWNDAPFFETEIDGAAASEAATYVTISSISYSLLIPRFSPSSRWINLTTQRAGANKSREVARTQAFLDSAKTLKIVFPRIADQMKPGRIPGDELLEVINGMLAAHRLQLADPEGCRFLVSKGMAPSSLELQRHAAGDVRGFWICPLVRPPAPPVAVLRNPADEVFEKLEHVCPGLFPPSGAWTRAVPNGALRSYTASDVKLYVLADGKVLYKYLRALNPELIGSVNDVLEPGFRMNCVQIRGRTGLPWEREI